MHDLPDDAAGGHDLVAALQRLQQLLMLLLLAALRPENQEVQEPEDQAELQEQQPHPGAGVARWGEQQREQALNDHGVSP